MKEILGKSWVQFSEECGEIVVDKVFVDPSERGRLRGYKLLDIVLEYARSQNMNIGLYAESDEETFSNEDLVEYYRNYGFESDGDCDQLMTYEV